MGAAFVALAPGASAPAVNELLVQQYCAFVALKKLSSAAGLRPNATWDLDPKTRYGSMPTPRAPDVSALHTFVGRDGLCPPSRQREPAAAQGRAREDRSSRRLSSERVEGGGGRRIPARFLPEQEPLPKEISLPQGEKVMSL